MIVDAGKLPDMMSRERLNVVVFLLFLVFSLVVALEKEEPPQCSEIKTSTDDEEQPPCVEPLSMESTDGEDEPTPLSLDESEDEAPDTSALSGTSNILLIMYAQLMLKELECWNCVQ